MALTSLTNSVESAYRYVVFDVETTGLSPGKGDRIIEIGAVAIEDKSIVEEFHSLIDIGREIPKTVQMVHGITNEMLSGKPTPEEIIPLFHEFIVGATLIGHNARFDVSFLKHEFERLKLNLTNRHLCTLKLSRKRYPHLPNHKLKTVGRYLFGKSIKEMKSHRALDDARLAAMIWLEMGKI